MNNEIIVTHFPAMSKKAIYDESNQTSLIVRAKSSTTTNSPFIRCLVEIATPTFNFSLEDDFVLQDFANEISETEWELILDDHQINFETHHLGLSGHVVGDISYIDQKTRELQMRRIVLPWTRTKPLSYSYPPVLPKPTFKENFLFGTPHSQMHGHQVHYRSYHESTHLTIDWTKITSTVDLDQEGGRPVVQCQLAIELACRLFQYQLHKLNETPLY